MQLFNLRNVNLLLGKKALKQSEISSHELNKNPRTMVFKTQIIYALIILSFTT